MLFFNADAETHWLRFGHNNRGVLSVLYEVWAEIVRVSPGQFHSAHALVFCGVPAQNCGSASAPEASLPAVSTLQARERAFSPPPHVVEQSFHGLQRDHLYAANTMDPKMSALKYRPNLTIIPRARMPQSAFGLMGY